MTGTTASILIKITFLLAGLPSEAGGAVAPDRRPVRVFAAAGTTPAVEQIAREYEKAAGIPVELNLASSSTLARQIEAGAQFDVFLSANQSWMDVVDTEGFIDSDTRRNLLKDRLAVVVPVGSDQKWDVHRGIDLDKSQRMALGDPDHVPAGTYARQALVNCGLWETYEDRSVCAASVRAAQMLVETGQCPVGIVYASGAQMSPRITIIHLFDESSHDPIRFCAAAARNSRAGCDFLHFLQGESAASLFRRCGFEIDGSRSIATSRSIGALASEPDLLGVLGVSIRIAAAALLVAAVPGIALGWVLARGRFVGKELLNSLVFLPLVIPPVVTGYLALLLLGRASLIGRWMENACGFSFAFHWTGAVLISAVMGLPLLVRSVKTVLETADDRYEKAAACLGARPFRTFWTVTMPLAGPGIIGGFVLAFARGLGEFGATMTFAGNIAGQTRTIPLAIYSLTQVPGGETVAARLIAISVTISIAAVLLSELLIHRMKRQ